MKSRDTHGKIMEKHALQHVFSSNSRVQFFSWWSWDYSRVARLGAQEGMSPLMTIVSHVCNPTQAPISWFRQALGMKDERALAVSQKCLKSNSEYLTADLDWHSTIEMTHFHGISWWFYLVDGSFPSFPSNLGDVFKGHESGVPLGTVVTGDASLAEACRCCISWVGPKVWLLWCYVCLACRIHSGVSSNWGTPNALISPTWPNDWESSTVMLECSLKFNPSLRTAERTTRGMVPKAMAVTNDCDGKEGPVLHRIWKDGMPPAPVLPGADRSRRDQSAIVAWSLSFQWASLVGQNDPAVVVISFCSRGAF